MKEEDRHSSMNIILCQELTSYNKLISYVRQAMSSLKEALAGVNVMSSDVEKTFHHVKSNLVLQEFKVSGFKSDNNNDNDDCGNGRS